MQIAFLVYDARSGSTLLSDLLTRRLGGVYVTPEIAFIRMLRLFGRRGRLPRGAELARRIVSDNLLRNLGIARDELESVLAALPDPVSPASVIRRILAAHLARLNADEPRCVVLKHGVHVRVWREIAAAFGGDARFIHVYRDPRAVVNSKLRTVRPYVQHETQAWYGPLLGAWRWRSYSAAMRKAAMSGAQVLDVKYEDLLADPDAELRRIAGFLDVPVRERHEEPAADYRIPDAERSIHALVEGGRVLQERAGAWSAELSAGDLRTIEAVASGEMEARGYAPSRQRTGAARLLVMLAGTPRLAKALLTHAWRQLNHRSTDRTSACRPG